jgi:isopenicillin N synthase-like dioxygenase
VSAWHKLPQRCLILQGLVSVIPLAQGTPGLRVFDYTASQWVDVESDCPSPASGCSAAGYALVFAGESLARLTCGKMAATVHEVAQLRGERLSVPFQALARHDALLGTAGTGTEPVTAACFLSETSRGMLSCY